MDSRYTELINKAVTILVSFNENKLCRKDNTFQKFILGWKALLCLSQWSFLVLHRAISESLLFEVIKY